MNLINERDKNNINNFYTNVDEYIGEKLRDLRKRQGLSPIECSKLIGISEKKIHKYEAGRAKVPPNILYKFCKLFSVTPNALFEGHFFYRKDTEEGSCEQTNCEDLL